MLLVKKKKKKKNRRFPNKCNLLDFKLFWEKIVQLVLVVDLNYKLLHLVSKLIQRFMWLG